MSKGFKLYSVSTATSLKSQAIFFQDCINHVNYHGEGPVNFHRLEGEGCLRIKYSRSPGSLKALQYSMTPSPPPPHRQLIFYNPPLDSFSDD